MYMNRYWLISTALLLTCVVPSGAGAETLNWNVRAEFGVSAQGIRQAIEEARTHFSQTRNDVVILELDEGSFYLEDRSASKGTIDLSGVKPGSNGRLVFRGKGIDETILVFADNKHAIYGRDVYRVTMTGMHMTRKDYTVSQGLIVETAPGKVVLEIQEQEKEPVSKLRQRRLNRNQVETWRRNGIWRSNILVHGWLRLRV